MNSAIDAVKNGMSYCTAASTFYVPKTTLMTRVGNNNKTLSEKQYLYGRNPLLGVSLEAELAENILEHSRRWNGMFINDVRKLAYKLQRKLY